METEERRNSDVEISQLGAWRVVEPSLWPHTQESSQEWSLQAEEWRNVPRDGFSSWPCLMPQNKPEGVVGRGLSCLQARVCLASVQFQNPRKFGERAMTARNKEENGQFSITHHCSVTRKLSRPSLSEESTVSCVLFCACFVTIGPLLVTVCTSLSAASS